ncbi:MAG: type VI secretion system domain-containing protein, partial [Bilophila sp.]
EAVSGTTQAVTQATTQAVAPSSDKTAPLQLEDVSAAHAAFHAVARDVLGFLCGAAPSTDVLVWKIVYCSLLGRINTLPPAEGGVTGIPAPDPTSLSAVRQALVSGKALQAVATGIGFVPACPLWLDVQRALAEALSAAGPCYAGALGVVRQECAALLLRVPGLEQLAFADNTPFADSETRIWVRSLGAKPACSETEDGGSKRQVLREAERQALQLFGQNNLAGALDVLEAAMTGQDKATCLRLRLRQMRLLCQGERWNIAAVLAEEVSLTAEQAALEQWDPLLALELWQAVQSVWTGLGEQGKAQGALTRVARLKPSAALTL